MQQKTDLIEIMEEMFELLNKSIGKYFFLCAIIRM